MSRYLDDDDPAPTAADLELLEEELEGTGSTVLGALDRLDMEHLAGDVVEHALAGAGLEPCNCCNVWFDVGELTDDGCCQDCEEDW